MEDKPSYWAVLPATVRYDEKLSSSAKLLYAEISALTQKTGYCYAENSYFEQLYSLSERTIIRLIRELEAGGYIRIDGGGTKCRKIYAGVNPFRDTDKNVSEPLTKMSVPTDKNVSAINNNINNNIIPPKPPRGQRRTKKEAEWKPERFEAFWKFYPPVNGKRPAKSRAISAWDRLRPDDETIARMGKALQREKNSRMWQDGVGIPYASSWLNSRAWEDEVVDTPKIVPEMGTSSGWAETGEVF